MPARRRRCRAEDGFSLIETLVAIAAGLAVIIALFTILEVTLHQTSRLTDYVQADQLGDTAMTRVVDYLRSACIAEKATPVLAGSTGTKLVFVTAFSEEAEIKAANVVKDQVELSGSNLWETLWTAKSTQTWPTFTEFESTAKAHVLLAQYVTAHTNAANEKYVFRYLRYRGAGASGFSESEGGVSTLEEIKLGSGELTEAQAKEVAAVQVVFSTAPADDYTKLSRPAEFSDEVGFSFTAPASEATISDGPCR